MTVKFKSCPRCKGDLHLNRDIYGNYRECLQCGFMQDIEKPGRLGKVLFMKQKEEVA